VISGQWSVVGVVLFFSLFTVHCSLFTAFAETIDTLTVKIEKEREELNEIEERISRQKTKVFTVKKEENSVLSKLNIVSRSFKIIEKELKVYDMKLAEIQGKKVEVEKRLKEMESAIDRQKKFLSGRLRTLYKEGNLSYIKVALSANDFTDFIQRMRYIEKIAEHDSVVIEDFLKNQKEMEENRLALLKSEEEIKGLKDMASKKREVLIDEKKEKERLLGEIKGKRIVYEKVQLELEDSSHQLMALIDALEKRKKDIAAMPPQKGLGDFAERKGILPWPVNGKIVSQFGKTKEERFNTYLFNNGIEIGSSQNVNIKTIYSGDIIFADWFKGYGKLIIVDHGNGYYSLYGHLDEIGVAVGDRVNSGDIIGKVGDTDSINGYTLYFEIRQKGKPEDPIAWLTPQKTAHK
jgi:septal ring factor EnvC (AmiA/AmiB activator)